jgi:hypothetical protein
LLKHLLHLNGSLVQDLQGSGVDVMIIILSNFCQFSAKKLAFFTKTNDRTNVLQKLAEVQAKNANLFAKFFAENMFK